MKTQKEEGGIRIKRRKMKTQEGRRCNKNQEKEDEDTRRKKVE